VIGSRTSRNDFDSTGLSSGSTHPWMDPVPPGVGADFARNGSHGNPVSRRQSGFDYRDDQEAERSSKTHSSALEDQTSSDEDAPSHEANEEGSKRSRDRSGGLTGHLRRWFS
jgi:hypothetical protein